MGIRSTVKALVVRGDRVLLNRCAWRDGTTYFDLPGGGQNQYEDMELALVREVREETGYDVRPVRFAALAEDIYNSPDMRTKYNDYTHRVFHVFIAELADTTVHSATELDVRQSGSDWVRLAEADNLDVRPLLVKGRVSELARSPIPIYLGTNHIPNGER